MVTQSRPLLRATPALPREAMLRLRRRAIFECCKWDPQVGDVSVLAPFAILIEQATWRQLAQLSEMLADETLAAERELLRRPELLSGLGLPRKVRSALRSTGAPPVEIARLMRFDFHLTPDGWRITEVNSDVPGGFVEAAGVTQLVADHFPAARVSADPAHELSNALARELPAGAVVGLVHATAYTDDRQVMVYLSRRIEHAGLRPSLLAPDQLHWRDGTAHIRTDWCSARADAIVRFFPGEWLINLPRNSGWQNFFAGSRTPLCNPAGALLTQSKRFPLVWDQLHTPLPTWRRLLPETHHPREVDWQRDERWILKPALGRVGDAIAMRGVTPCKDWRKIARWAFWRPALWAAQRRFDATPVETETGTVYPCVGVYTIAGRACGIYGRAASKPLINHCAQDVAVLVVEDATAHRPKTEPMEPIHATRAAV